MKIKKPIIATLSALTIAALSSGCSAPAPAAAPESSTAATSAASTSAPASPTVTPSAPASTSAVTSAPAKLPAPAAQAKGGYQPYLDKTGPGQDGAARYLQTFFMEFDGEMDKYKSPDKSLSDAESTKATYAQLPLTMGFLDESVLGQKRVDKIISGYGLALALIPSSYFVVIDPDKTTVSGDTVTFSPKAIQVRHAGVTEQLSDTNEDTFTLTYGKDYVWKITGYTSSDLD